MNIISDIFTLNIESVENAELINESEISMGSDAFDLMDNDVVTLKPSHDFMKNKKNYSSSHEAPVKAVIFNSDFQINKKENDSNDYIDSQFYDQVSFHL